MPSTRVSRCRVALAVALLLLRGVCALVQNRTIDDSLGDQVSGRLPTYAPNASVWNVGVQCDNCFAQPDISQTFDHTWHDTTMHATDPQKSVTMKFNGTAVYAYCIIPNTIPGANSLTNLTFMLDGKQAGTYQYVPNSSNNFKYGVNVYTNKNLRNTEHTFVIKPNANPNASILLFDYITYTFDSDPTASAAPTANKKARTNIGAIVGGVVGGVAALALLGVLVFFLLRRRRVKKIDKIESANLGAEVSPFMDDLDGPGAGSSRPTHSTYPSMSQTPGTSSIGPLHNPWSDRSTDSAAGSQYGYGAGAGGATAAYGHSQDPSLLRAYPESVVPPSTAPASSTSDLRASAAPAPPVPPRGGARSKAAMRREEVDAQVRDMEARVANLQAQRSHSMRRNAGAQSASSGAPSDQNEGAMATQIEELKEEVERLRSQQRQMLWEMSDQPPPGYHDEGHPVEVVEAGGEQMGHHRANA